MAGRSEKYVCMEYLRKEVNKEVGSLPDQTLLLLAFESGSSTWPGPVFGSGSGCSGPNGKSLKYYGGTSQGFSVQEGPDNVKGKSTEQVGKFFLQ
jgi:hypothetical protein